MAIGWKLSRNTNKHTQVKYIRTWDRGAVYQNNKARIQSETVPCLASIATGAFKSSFAGSVRVIIICKALLELK